ncbi:MAG TPA: S9 family peptidase, partial [Acidobacteriota bacterium]|nr:S9 family peptidase [Acidobacteriota bacterium]
MMRNNRFLPLVVVSLLTVGLGVLAAQDKRPVTIDDYFALKNVGSPRISPDGEWVAYTVRTTDFEKDKSETAIWMMPYAGGEAIRMTGKGNSASQPRWSPDGKYLSFLASRGEDAKTQVWILNRQGGEAQQLTEVKQGVGSHSWSPDASRLLLSIRDPEEDEEEGGQEGEDAKGKKDKPKPWVIDRLQFKRDNAGYLDRRRTHYYVFDVESKELRQITSGDYDDNQGVWSPDGTLVAFVSNRTEEPDGNSNNDIWIVSADNTDKGKTLKRVTDNPGSDGSPDWSPDGKRIVYNTVLEPEIIWYATGH